MKKIVLFAALIAVSFTTFAQIGVGTSSPDPSAELEVASTTKGLLIPRLNAAQVSTLGATAAEGLLVYCTDCTVQGVALPGFYGFTNGAFVRVSPTSSTSSNLDAALSEIYEDHAGGDSNANGTAVTLAQLQELGITPQEIVNPNYIAEYQAGIQAVLLLSNPPTVGEVRTILLNVNRDMVFAEILEDSNSVGGDNNANGIVVTLEQLQSLGLYGVNANLIAGYQAEIQAANYFSDPPLATEVQNVIFYVNEQAAINKILAQVLEDSASTGGASNADGVAVTINQLEALGLNNLDPALLADYQAAIQAETGFSNLPTILELQTVIDDTNQAVFSAGILAKIGNGETVTNQELLYLGLTNYYPPFVNEYNTEFTVTTFSSPATVAEVQAAIDQENSDQQAATPFVYSPETDKIWMDRNLGATQVATAYNDAASYGGYYQWGRNSDGHESSSSTVVAGPVASGSEGSDFITNGTTPFDWLSTQDNSRWSGSVKGTEDPCPTGYRVPTSTEWANEYNVFKGAENRVAAFNSVLKLPSGGRRLNDNGLIATAGVYGLYWASSVSATNGSNLIVYPNVAGGIGATNRAVGMLVRCIRE
ncbi:hypothetical protein GCM10023314_05600 [Algibacter agarivorans]|uniref:Fibrobacter succinogenes major paralogous domain-containing protein n=1 Tax=Algibacter agarivorans TaxID=1109741 RepID=A0ABP9GEB9_9FLAO